MAQPLRLRGHNQTSLRVPNAESRMVVSAHRAPHPSKMTPKPTSPLADLNAGLLTCAPARRPTPHRYRLRASQYLN